MQLLKVISVFPLAQAQAKQSNDLDVLDELDDQVQLMNFQDEQVSGLLTMDYGLQTTDQGKKTNE